MNIDLLTFARSFSVLGLLLGISGIIGGALLVIAYINDRVSRFGWRHSARRLLRPHPADRVRHRQPAPHPHFTRHHL